MTRNQRNRSDLQNEGQNQKIKNELTFNNSLLELVNIDIIEIVEIKVQLTRTSYNNGYKALLLINYFLKDKSNAS